MRNIFLFMMVSIDGYFEGIDHDLSWHNVDAEFHKFANQQLSSIGTLLFGHRTYELMASWWPTPQGTADNPITAKLMNELPKIVVSKNKFLAEWNNTTVINTNVVEEIKKLKKMPGKDIAIFGSNNLCISLMQAELIDEFRIMVSPIVLGKGSSLFIGLPMRTKMKLLQTREFKSGNVLHYYSPLGKA